MDIFDILTLVGGLCLFLFGMNLMGEALERRAGNSLQSLLGKMTSKKLAGFLTGLGVTAIIQSSSATTVMVVGFVNSGLMTLRQAINVIMGANVGTTVTAWILGLSGIGSDNIFMRLLKPTSFTPVLALIGIIFCMFGKSTKKKDTGTVLLGFATLMFGMDTMSDAVAGLANVPAFTGLFTQFADIPVLGMLAGAVLTCIIQSSSASVGILQALASTGAVSFGAAFPIIMGQNIGTCVTAMISSVGAKKNARRAAVVHLSFNVIGTAVWLTVFYIVRAVVNLPILSESVGAWGIPVCHSIFNVACTLLLLPMSRLLEKLACRLIPDQKEETQSSLPPKLDERLLATPAIALQQCHQRTVEMARIAEQAIENSLTALTAYTPELAESIRAGENAADYYEDDLGSYLVKLSGHQLEDVQSAEAAKLLRLIGDFERISDHSVNVLEAAEELREKSIVLTPAATSEINVLVAAVREVLHLTQDAFIKNDIQAAYHVEPLEQVIDDLKEQMRARHILRLQQGYCTIEAGFVLSDLLTNLERVSDHCSNIAGCVLDMAHNDMNLHASLRATRTGDAEYAREYEGYTLKYHI